MYYHVDWNSVTHEEIQHALEIGTGQDERWVALMIRVNFTDRMSVVVGGRNQTNLPLARSGRTFTEAFDEDVLGVTRLNGVPATTAGRFQASFDQSDAFLVVHFR